ncbi:phage tail assembly chaperone [Pseudomonas sp. KU43P]|uniref:phage tail assembly chaperone n=1 Tax=Pseudomonas sp. KU43P TaxID=2487887 RepID=UPI002953A86D|nr:phage tail assembly chaperone [Pseudomonas sp. KU43P]
MDWKFSSVNVQPGWLYANGEFAKKVEQLDERMSAEREWRDGELVARQWLRDRHRDEQDLNIPTSISNEQFVELLEYMQALREWPNSQSFPTVAMRPISPIWLELIKP